MKKVLVLLFIIIILYGCENSNSKQGMNNLNDVSLTGTWIAVNETKMFKTETGEYLSSEFVKLKYVFEDTDAGVKYDRCWEYGGIPAYGIKTDRNFYMQVTENGYSLQDDGSLIQTSEFIRDYQPGFNFESIVTLTKISEDVSIDNGTYVLNGPVTNAEYDQVCLWQVDYSIGNERIVEILVPYDNDSLSLRFDLRGDISPGTFEYAGRGYDAPIRIDVNSGADLFRTQVSSNTLNATNASITIIESSQTTMTGNFTFTGQDAGSYSGEFEIIY